MDTIELKGLTFRVEIKADENADAPWDSCDGHGPVRRVRDALARTSGERTLAQGWLYDYAEALVIAKRDGWWPSAEALAALGPNPTPEQRAKAAVECDFRFLRRYCEGDWSYIGVVVTLLDVDGEPTGISESLWGIESDAYDYHKETANELAGEISRQVGPRRKYLQRVIQVRK